MIYIINFNIDENDDFYPNYYMDDTDKNNIKYYDIYLTPISDIDYHKYAITKQDGSGKNLQVGGVKTKEQLKKEKENQEAELLEEDSPKLITESSSQWKFIKDLLIGNCYQDFALYGVQEEYDTKLEKYIETQNVDLKNKKQKYKEKYKEEDYAKKLEEYIEKQKLDLKNKKQEYKEEYNELHNQSLKSYKDKFFKILEMENLYIKSLSNNTYYYFNKLSDLCKKEIVFEMITNTKTFWEQKALYSENKVAYCLNYFCIHSAVFDGAIKQRQQCAKCKDYEKFGKIRQTGWGFEFETKPHKKFKIIEIYDYRRYTVSTYTNMCYNNFSPEYWNNLEVRLDGKNREQAMDGYVFQYKHPVNRTMDPIQINGKNYLCELRNPWNSYTLGLIELDHTNGKHNENNISNINPLCKICHGIKTHLQQDKSSIVKDIEAQEAAAEGAKKDATVNETIKRYKNKFSSKESARVFINKLNRNVYNNIKATFFILEEGKMIPAYKEVNTIWNIYQETSEETKQIDEGIVKEKKQNDMDLEEQEKIETKLGNTNQRKMLNQVSQNFDEIDIIQQSKSKKEKRNKKKKKTAKKDDDEDIDS
jgi:hypothetical protein